MTLRPSLRLISHLISRRAANLLILGGLVLTPLSVFAPEAFAQGALRAPLNIIPAPMQANIGQPPSEVRQDKLAPRVAARQSKRAVRAVAAAPGAEGGIVQVGSLGTLQDAPVGLETGFGSDLWRGARLAFIADQMGRLPPNTTMHALRDMELTLHRGATAAPVGTVDGTSWYAARLNRFLALGDTVSVLALEQLTGAAGSDGYAAAAVAKAHLGQGNETAACAVARPTRQHIGYGDVLPFFMRLMVYCQLRAGEYEKAGLALELNERTLGEDRLFRDIAYLMAAQVAPRFGTAAGAEAARAADEEPPIVLPNELKPLQIMLLKLAGQALPVELTKLPPFMAQNLAADYGQKPLLQLRAAHMAALQSVKNAPNSGAATELFSQVSQLADLSAWPDPYASIAEIAPLQNNENNAEASEENIEPDGLDNQQVNLPDAVFLAYSLRLVDMAPLAAQAKTIADVLRTAHGRGLWSDAIIVLADRLADVPIGPTEVIEAFESIEAVQPVEAGGEAIDTQAGQTGSLNANQAEVDPLANPLANDAAALAELADLVIAPADKAVLLAALRYAASSAVGSNGQTIEQAAAKAEALISTDIVSDMARRWLDFGQAEAQTEAVLAALGAADAFAVSPGSSVTAGAIGAENIGGTENIAVNDTSLATASSVSPEMRQMSREQPDANRGPQSLVGFDDAPMVETRVHPIADMAAFEAQLADASTAQKRFMRRELAVYHGLQFELSDALLAALNAPQDDATYQRLGNLAQKQWTGDLLLALVAQYGNERPQALKSADIVTLLTTLRDVGLSDQANALAQEILAHAAAELAVTQPQALLAEAF